MDPDALRSAQGLCNPAVEKLLTARQVSERLGVSVCWVRDHATRSRPRLPVVRLGPRTVRFVATDIERFTLGVSMNNNAADSASAVDLARLIQGLPQTRREQLQLEIEGEVIARAGIAEPTGRPPIEECLRKAARGGGRDRHQRGRVEAVGTRVKKWRGHYYIYERQPDGSEVRHHKTVTLGLKASLKKWEAQAELQKIIDRATGGGSIPAGEITLEWFWRERFLPMKSPAWKSSSRGETIKNIERYVVAQLGEIPLASIDKFTVQTHLNKLAEKFGHSVVEKARIWSRAILEEAVDQDFLRKNPARKLVVPETKRVVRKVVDAAAIAEAFPRLPIRERLMLRLALVLGLRPGEILGLRWNDVFPQSIRVDEEALDGKMYSPKTEASISHVWLPAEVAAELEEWRGQCDDISPEAMVFRSSGGNALDLNNYRKRFFRPALEAVGLVGVTFQMLRRSCATFLVAGRHGSIKDVQAHLRHAQPSTTLGVYVQAIPETVRGAVESLNREIFGGIQPAAG